jgi:hypothetical protein
VRRRPLGREARELRVARCCYDHLAGWLGVAVTTALLDRDLVRPAEDRLFAAPPAGTGWFAALDVDARLAGRQCLDWTERRHHLGGPLGVRLLAALCGAGHLRRSRTGRAVQVTPQGTSWLRAELGVDPARAAEES